MHSLAEKQLISCQIGYIPLEAEDYIKEIDEVLEVIKESKLTYEISGMSTTISGPSEKVFDLIRDIHNTVAKKEFKYTMNIIVSNICGC